MSLLRLPDISYRVGRMLRHYSDQMERKRLAQELGAPSLAGVSMNFLRAARAINASKSTIRRLIDVGANKGAFTRTAMQLWPLDQIICVEPSEDLVRHLTAVMPSQVSIVQAALGRNTGQADFYLHASGAMNSLLPVDEKVFSARFKHFNSDQIRQSSVPVRTLDSLLADLGGDGRDVFLKIDAQGAEFDILQAGDAVLKRCSVCLIEHMFWGGYRTDYELGDLVSFLEARDFRCRGVIEPRYQIDGGVAFADLLFVR